MPNMIRFLIMLFLDLEQKSTFPGTDTRCTDDHNQVSDEAALSA